MLTFVTTLLLKRILTVTCKNSYYDAKWPGNNPRINGISLDEKTDCTVFAPIILKLQLSFYSHKV